MEDLQRFEPYTLHVYDLSYFSGKMQCYLRYKEIPHRSSDISIRELATRIAPYTGLVEVPVVERADGVFLRDSTAMIEWFEARYTAGNAAGNTAGNAAGSGAGCGAGSGAGSVLPADPASAFLCRLLEDYADEGLWRPALYYRWAFAKDALLNSRRFTEDFLSFPLTPAFVLRSTARRRQQRVYMAGEGITATNRADVERHYLDELRDLEAVFQKRGFLFGDRPSMADFGYFASMFRHFSIDPTPARIMRDQAPAVYEWVARMWNARASRIGKGEWAATKGGIPEDLGPLFARAARRYLPALHANARAVADGVSHFDVLMDGKPYPHLAAVPFQAWRRSVLQRAMAALPDDAFAEVRATLTSSGCLEWLERDGILESNYPEGDLLPLSRPRRIGLKDRLRMQIFGTPHHHEAGTPTRKA